MGVSGFHKFAFLSPIIYRQQDEEINIAKVKAQQIAAQLAQQNEDKIQLEKQFKEQQQLLAMERYVKARKQANLAAQINQARKKTKKDYEYNSDEEIDEDGTWEHKARKAEMEATKGTVSILFSFKFFLLLICSLEWADKLSDMSDEKHHIGDFLPPEEYMKFKETFQALKAGTTLTTSDFEKFKLTCDNVGFKMLQKMGWKEGEGLGSSGQGIKEPISRGQATLGDGSGASSSATIAPVASDFHGKTGADIQIPNDFNLTAEDDDFDAYRKRMMLAYRFRPNPLNNPRRPYF